VEMITAVSLRGQAGQQRRAATPAPATATGSTRDSGTEGSPLSAFRQSSGVELRELVLDSRGKTGRA
jgi:hypothetical protein